MKPWREVAVPHSDVLKGTFQQAEFAADLTAVRTGKAPEIYRDAHAFFDRTYVTAGLEALLTQVARRLNGGAGEPVIQLQTAFGGGKTHSLLAVLHMASREGDVRALRGLGEVLDAAGIDDVPRAKVVVLDGNAHSPGQSWKSGRTTIHTLWGELAWQLGGADAYSTVRESDEGGTSPGKEILRSLLERHAPCVILIDELVAYVRQLPEKDAISGGEFGGNLSFAQALTEVVGQVDGAVLLATLPESEVEAGGERGERALAHLSKTFGRVQSLWQAAGADEAFEIVRRRLFEPVRDEAARDEVCAAFVDAYREAGAGLPSEVHEARYLERLRQAYPIHPEMFERLYLDWSTLEGFQRTRGVLKLMAKVIHRLWKANDRDPLIMPGSLPLADGEVRAELTYLLPNGWVPVIESDIDGERAETLALESREARFGKTAAARRVARTLFLATAPSSVAVRPGTRGVDKARVLLGCLQPGQVPSDYLDALGRLADRLHYLNASGDRTAENTRFWFDTRANLRREMEDRKGRFDDATDVTRRIQRAVDGLFRGSGLFDGVHVFTPHADVPDDASLRLIVLPPTAVYAKELPAPVFEAAGEFLRLHGGAPRHRANRLIFIAADQSGLSRLRDVVRTSLAWDSIVEDVDGGRLNIDQAQKKQAQAEAKAAAEVVPRAAREAFRWLLCPGQADPRATDVTWEAFTVPTSGGDAAAELDRVCTDNELLIERWSPVHLRSLLRDLYWREDRPYVAAVGFWEDSLRYLYLPRLRSREVYADTVRMGSQATEFYGTAQDAPDGRYEGFRLGSTASLTDTLVLIEPGAAAAHAAALTPVPLPPEGPGGPDGSGGGTGVPVGGGGVDPGPASGRKARAFRGSVAVDPNLAKSRLNTIAEEIIALLTNDPDAEVRVTLEIDAEFPGGADEATRRGVSENANSLGFTLKEWEA